MLTKHRIARWMCVCPILVVSLHMNGHQETQPLPKSYYWEKQWGNKRFGTHVDVSSTFSGTKDQVENINTFNAVSYIFGRRDQVLQGKVRAINTPANDGRMESSIYIFGNKIAGQQNQNKDDTISQVYNLVFDQNQDFGIVLGPVNLRINVGLAGKADTNLRGHITPNAVEQYLKPSLVAETYVQGESKALLINAGLEGRVTLFSEVVNYKSQMGPAPQAEDKLCHSLDVQGQRTSLNGKVGSYLKSPFNKMSVDLFNFTGVASSSQLLSGSGCEDGNVAPVAQL